MQKIVEITTTVSSEGIASELARAIVTSRLAACVQITGPLLSIYRWQGDICEAQEWRCTIKTFTNTAPQLIELVNRLHPYEVPEILLFTAESSSAAYTQWMAEQVHVAEASNDE